MKKKRFERAVDGFFTVAAIVLILVLVYTVALRVLAAGAGLPDGESEGGTTPVQEIHPPLPEAGGGTTPQSAVPTASLTRGAIAGSGKDATASPSEGAERKPDTSPAKRVVAGEERPASGRSLGLQTQAEAEQSEPGSDDAVIVREDIPMDQVHQAALVEICREAGVDINLAYGLIMTESSFNPWAVSATGCYGYCQLSCYFPAGLNPVENLRAGIGWLGELIAQHGDVGKALTVYHLGHDDGTRDYAGVVLGYARGFGYAG